MSSEFVFSRARNPNVKKLSVLCINKNHADFIEDNLLSVAAQKFDDFEYLVADGGSTDGSLAIIARYDFATVLPGVDRSVTEGLMRGASAATGEYVMVTTSTDGYLSRDWFRIAVEALDSDPEAALVWGASLVMRTDGSLSSVVYPKWFKWMPQKRQWFFRWIHDRRLSRSYLPELNYCVRRPVLQALIAPTDEFPELNDIDPMLRFLFRFNRAGYLPLYIPAVANFGRAHEGRESATPYSKLSLENFRKARRRYRRALWHGDKSHVFRDGAGNVLTTLSRPGLILGTVAQTLQTFAGRLGLVSQ